MRTEIKSYICIEQKVNTMKKTKREFILDTLLPFKENPSTCAYENGNCVYLAENDNKCAIGKHMKEGGWQLSIGGFSELLADYEKEDFLTNEALEQNLTNDEWSYIQGYHDKLADTGKIGISLVTLERKTGLKFPELKY